MFAEDRTSSNGLKLQKERFRLDGRRNFLNRRMVKYWNRLSSECVEFPTWTNGTINLHQAAGSRPKMQILWKIYSQIKNLPPLDCKAGVGNLWPVAWIQLVEPLDRACGCFPCATALTWSAPDTKRVFLACSWKILPTAGVLQFGMAGSVV